MKKDCSNGNIVDVLLLLSRDRADNVRVFECKTCNRRFSSFQALGGHRASHKRPKLSSSSTTTEDDHNNRSIKPKVHECSICGLQFAVGQALGGHMRRHRTTINEEGGLAEKKTRNGKRVLLFDLNLPPSSLELVI